MRKQGKYVVTLILILGLLMQSVVSLGNPGTASRAAETEQGENKGIRLYSMEKTLRLFLR